MVRLQSQQMLDQIHSDEPLQASGTGPVDGDNDSSDSAEDPCESLHGESKTKIFLGNPKTEITGSVAGRHLSSRRFRDSDNVEMVVPIHGNFFELFFQLNDNKLMKSI